MTIYCPACGNAYPTTEIEAFCPGWMPQEWRCPGCRTRFRLKVEYRSREEEE